MRTGSKPSSNIERGERISGEFLKSSRGFCVGGEPRLMSGLTLTESSAYTKSDNLTLASAGFGAVDYSLRRRKVSYQAG